MRRLAPFLVVAFLLAGCGGKQIVMPTAETVVGTVAAQKQQAAGDAKAGAALFKAQYAKTANQGSLQDFTHESIANPSAYIEKGYANAMPNFGSTLSDKQIADLVAYVTKNQG
jgi:hypothetical protein